MTTLILRPHDSLFLRDGRPFNQADQEQAATAAIFPPYPPTVVGAIRAALARATGWPETAWPTGLGSGVDWSQGDGPLGPLRFSGPFVLRDGAPLFPAPLCLLVKRSDEGFASVVRLRPGTPIDCDLGRVAIPVPVRRIDGGKAPEDVWIDGDGLQALLDWGDPKRESLVPRDALWKTEERVGIARDEKTRTTGEGALYAAAHVRLRDKGSDPVALAVRLDGGGADLIIGTLAPLGGEGRSVWMEAGASIDLPRAATLKADADGILHYTVVLLTPAFFADDWPQPGGTLIDGAGAALPGRVVSACVGKPVSVGGWDGINRAPLPLRPLAPAGSVWFMEAAAGDADAVLRRQGTGIGRATAWGFGLALIGRWERGESRGESNVRD